MLMSTVSMLKPSNFKVAVAILRRTLASSPVNEIVNDKNPDEKFNLDVMEVDPLEKEANKSTQKRIKSNLVASAFASLKKSALPDKSSMSATDLAISQANNPDNLLTLVGPDLTRGQGLKILSALAEMSLNRDSSMSDFDDDQRFLALCELLGRNQGAKGKSSAGSSRVRSKAVLMQEDLSVVLNIKNDDEALGIISTFTPSQMIKVMSALAYKKRRSLSLLRGLSSNLGQNNSKYDVKQCADILYALATLNFPDEVLLEKVCSDLYDCIPKCLKTSVIGSIATSIGILRLKDIDLLDIISEWAVNNRELCRPQDLVSIFYTLATVDHVPSTCDNFFENLRPNLIQADLSLSWLDVVWSLTVLSQANHNDFQSVLNDEFVKRLSSANQGELSMPTKRKLLNINGAAKWAKGYQGPLLEADAELSQISFSKSKDKQSLVSNVMDTLSNLLPSSIYLRTNVDLGMGFVIDGECLIDSKMTPLPVVDRKTGEPVTKSQKGSKIAVMVWDYSDHTKGGRIDLCGPQSLYIRLAMMQGYKVLSVPYTNYNACDKLTNRVQYLEKNLKVLVSPS